MSAPAPPAVFDPLEEGFVEWPYDQYRRLRAEDPVHRSELLHAWVVTRHADVNTILRDPSVSSEIDNAAPTPATVAEIQRRDDSVRGGRTLVLLDDPDHARLRRLIARPFRLREVERLGRLVEDRVRARVDALVATHGRDTQVELDLIAEFAYPLPVEIFCQMLGIPEEDHPVFRFWVNCIARSLDPVMDAAERDELVVRMGEMYAYLEELVAAKRGRDDGDVLSGLVHAEEDGQTLSHEDLLGQIMTLYVAGHEPTAGLVGNGMRALLDFPDQWAALQADRSLLRNAVSELLRYDGPNQFVRRIAMRDMTFDTPGGQVTIPARSVIYASPASANRDEANWGSTVDQVDIARADAGGHLQFGAGAHACLGSHLARLQAEAMFTAIVERFEDIELAGEPVWSTRMVIRGLNRLPVRARLR
ncbi:MAG TPA: cytochrome P450 [Acidimicrobiales bacterium]|nr:cytochrome P450 [Acidimicrobiales bacterium]